MAEAFAPFIIQRTMCNLTFYVMEGRNFVRKKSSLTRRKVLYSPQFENTRHFAALMAKASKIGSLVYSALPEYWRQGWMYRSFTGEAYKMIKAGKKEDEIQQFLLQRYVQPVVSKITSLESIASLPKEPKRSYRKLDTNYWKNKTRKSIRRKANRQRLMYNAGLLARASKIGSKLYALMNPRYKCRSFYQQLTGWVMQFLKDEWDEADIIAVLLPDLKEDQSEKCHQAAPQMNNAGVVVHPRGQYYFFTSLHKRFDVTAIALQLPEPAPPQRGAMSTLCNAPPLPIPYRYL
jgi:hypothetical protein